MYGVGVKVRVMVFNGFNTVILCYVQIPSQLFDLRAVCHGNNELFLVPWNKTLKYLNYFLLGFYSKV